ncbi:hypothetical protein [Liquorilactobacillus sicerae]|uniref:hypothetical protein n=1 Tax=Liquorilactobacillus sicerae TaxID=1416943 RepID=UPI002480E6EB|nr:hypothetical protein [Liquorilactobacillus sicerae]
MDFTGDLKPINLAEVQTKLQWNLAHQQPDDTTEKVILAAILENVRDMVVDALEGPYWSANWQVSDKKIAILNITDQQVGTLQPESASFIQDFQTDAPHLITRLNKNVQKIVADN